MNNKNKNDYKYFNFQYTRDGSVGLYNHDVQDVYHSIYGAKTEGWEKFVLPLDFEKNFAKKKSIRVLDICFGIGYNTKAFLKKIIQNKYKGNVHIDALEYDKNLVILSPFIKDGYFKFYPEISFLLLDNLAKLIYNNKNDLNFIVANSQNMKFIEPFYRYFIKNNYISRCLTDPIKLKQVFVHNIYYHCISHRIKKSLNRFKNNNIVIRPYFDDARSVIKSLNLQYDIIFLDAFTPTKLPTLWSYDFFNELFRLSHDSTQLITYSNSAAVRHAMYDAGFNVGKLFDKNNRHCGTIATKNKTLLKLPLDDYDFGLMKTNAGIYYRDENLDKSAEEIIKEYIIRKSILGLESSSQYIKRFNKNHTEIKNG